LTVAGVVGVLLTACSGVADVKNVPAATESVSTPDSVAAAPGSTAPLASAAPFESGDAAVWTPVEVIDGDTLRAIGPDGEQTVRMIGINAPEQGECFYDEATAALQFSVGDRDLRLVSDVSDVDQYGRKLRYVELVDGIDVGAELVKSGYARSHHYDPDVSRNDLYDELQAEAEQAGAGLWAPDACGAPVASGVSIAVNGQYNAPGDDNFNLNEEWVRFTNTGSAPVDVSGWEVADESSSHRYTFEELTLAPGSSVTLYTGCGTDGPSQRYWCNKDSAVWNNSGDTVFLKDASGNTVAAETYRE
jgi:endonuclease YncB( thermonuclease family)